MTTTACAPSTCWVLLPKQAAVGIGIDQRGASAMQMLPESQKDKSRQAGHQEWCSSRRCEVKGDMA